jgi:ABC-type multidrug transport system ATPase subunit
MLSSFAGRFRRFTDGFSPEKTVGLDPTARHDVWQRIRALRDDTVATILLTTHDMDEAGRLCEYLAFMDQGKLVA